MYHSIWFQNINSNQKCQLQMYACNYLPIHGCNYNKPKSHYFSCTNDATSERHNIFDKKTAWLNTSKKKRKCIIKTIRPISSFSARRRIHRQVLTEHSAKPVVRARTGCGSAEMRWTGSSSRRFSCSQHLNRLHACTSYGE